MKFDLGRFNISEPALMDAGVQRRLAEGADQLNVPHLTLPSGAGHDAQDFALAGFPAGMIFVRNANGSHNPREAMEMADFALGTRLLAWTPLRILFAAHPELLAPVLQIIHRVIARFLLKQAGLKRCAADTGAVTLIQRFGSAAYLNIHLHCLLLDGVYRRTEGEPDFQKARAPTRAELEGLLEKIIARLMKVLTVRSNSSVSSGLKSRPRSCPYTLVA